MAAELEQLHTFRLDRATRTRRCWKCDQTLEAFQQERMACVGGRPIVLQSLRRVLTATPAPRTQGLFDLL